ncbi:MAG: ADP-ribosylglycohydrolase family protein [Propionibacterium sp.]|nr:ADP-ribosylglycohydrolase family protein [Propionibacterium sp.]
MTDERRPDGPALAMNRSRVHGCLLGGAIGDALGGPVEFWSLDRIQRVCGRAVVREYVAETVAGEPCPVRTVSARGLYH